MSAAACLVLMAGVSSGTVTSGGDTTAPTSAASSPAYSTSPAIAVAYSASDAGGGLSRVELWARTPDGASFSRVRTHTVTGTAVTGTFSYSAAGEGRYAFYTVAVDAAGNAEAAPATPDSTTLLDRSLPVSSAASPAYTNTATFPVSYEAADRGPAGLASVRLFARAPGAGGYRREAVDASPGATGEFQYTAITPDGTYSFYTRALDRAGNDEPAPATPDSVTVLDRSLPSSRASSPETAGSSSFRVTYDASDAGPAGLAEVQLWARGPGESAYAKAATDASPTATGGFDYRARLGDGGYSFMTVAVDRAGNTEKAPAVADSTTVFASIPPAVTIDGVSDVLLGAADASVDVTWTSDQPGTYTVRAGGEDCSTGAVAASGEYSSAAMTTNVGAELLGEGLNTIAVCVVNADARTGSATASVEKDTSAPVSRVASPPVSGSRVLAVSYEAQDAGSGLAEVELYAQAPGDSAFAKVATDSAPAAHGGFSYTAAADGEHRFYTIAVDRAGNAESAPDGADATSVVDTRAPHAASTFPRDGGSFTAAGWDAGCGSSGGDVCGTATDETSGVEAVKVSLQRASDGAYWDGSSFSAATEVLLDASGTTTWSYVFSSAAFPGDGRYTLRARAVDRAGNAGEAVVSAFTVDVAPAVSAGGPYVGQEGSAIRLAGSVAGDATTTAWSYQAVGGEDPGTACALGSPGSLSTTFSCTDDGTYRLTLTASDGVNPPVTSSTTVTIANAAPSVAVKSPLNGAYLSRFIPVTVTASFQDAGRNDRHGGGAGSCQVDWGDGSVTAGSVVETAGSGSGTCSASHAYARAGAYAVKVTVTDDDDGSGVGSVAITLL